MTRPKKGEVMTIRIKDATTYSDGKVHLDIALASSDEKPTDGVATGSVCMEADTGKRYLFDETSGTWSEA